MASAKKGIPLSVVGLVILVQIEYVVKNSNFLICQFPGRFSEHHGVYTVEKKINMEQEVLQEKLRSHLTSLSSIMTIKYGNHSHINLFDPHLLCIMSGS
jgi:hypothetical protein